MEKEKLSLKMLFAAIILIVVGVLLMLQSSNMLFEMNPLSITVMVLTALFIFSGITLLIIAIASVASV